MSDKNLDSKKRWRSKTVAFRMSPEEAYQLDILANTSGLTKQDYLINRVLNKDIVVYPNIRVQKFLLQYLIEIADVLSESKVIEQKSDALENLKYIAEMISKMQKKDFAK